MIDFELEQLQKHPEWRLVLSAYHAEHLAAAQSDHWAARLTAVEGVPPEHLARIHGKLIALGYLKFELADRAAGVRYQVSRAGRQALDLTQPLEMDDDAELAQSA